ncbi:hypothetical protein G6F56_012632 [Rhizopus delemar]|nr:hypothetical protein G6F56_012632 [Rhizopus delemar]
MNTFENSLPAASLISPTSPNLSVASICSYGSTIHSLDITFASDCDEIPQLATKPKVVVLADTMEDYVRAINEERGREAAYEALYTFFGVMERKEIMDYKIEGIVVDRATYTSYVLNEVLVANDEIQTETIVPNEEMDEVTWNELISQITWTTEEEIAQYELLLTQNFQHYKELVEADHQNNLNRRRLSYQLAQNVTAWAHLRFNQPNNSDRRSINTYLADKNRALKFLIPEYSNFRTLTHKLRLADNWGQMDYQIGTDLSAVWGSVAQQPFVSWNTENITQNQQQ